MDTGGPDLVGTELGDFQIESLLGQGSMAHVYAARQISLRRQVALKVLEEGIFTPGENIKRFLREAEAMARLEHPHIVPVYAAGDQKPYYFFAMRLIRGGTLHEAMTRGITRATALAWAIDICRALAFAHTAGVVHRDLKPTNVLIQENVALLSDFGLARLRDVSTITQLGFVLGTPMYMAPEQTLGEPAEPPADCFALGVIMYQMFTGRHPFVREERTGLSRAERRTRLFKRIQNADCQPPSAHDPEIPREIEDVIVRALTRKPEDRFPNGPAMLSALEDASRRAPGASHVVRAEKLGEKSGTPAGQQQAAVLGSTCASPAEPPAAPRAKETPSAPRTRTEKSSKSSQRTLGRYKLLKEIGHGGQGVVYEAHDPVLDRVVALKVLRGDATDESRQVDLFWHEARIAAKLTHPHIITIYDFGIENDCPYLTMQLVDGSSLDKLLEPRRPLPPAFALQVLAQAAEALSFAHQAHVVHLDVKPGNILIRHAADTERPHIFLTDFTMARLRKATRKAQQSTHTAQGAGTVAYASPEQLENAWETLGPASDIFSLGVVFHEMLTGQRLFKGETPEVIREQVLSAKIAPPSAFVPGLPAGVDGLCGRMLIRPLKSRLQSAAEVLVQARTLMRDA